MFLQTPVLRQETQIKLGRGDWLVLAGVFCAYLPFIFLGYGSDNDAYGVIDSGRMLWTNHQYIPSRNPGYLLFEITMLLLNSIGGSILCNLATVAVSLVAIGLFQWLCLYFAVPHRVPLSLIFGLEPTFWLNATSVSDHSWGLMLVLLAMVLMIRDRHLLAGVIMGLALSTRLASFIGVGAVGIFALATQPQRRSRIIIAGLIGIAIGVACYIPPWLWAKSALGNPWRFLEAQAHGSEDWTITMRLGRFGYRNIYFWGLPAAFLLAGVAGWGAASLRALLRDNTRRPIILLSLATILGYELLFLRYPIEKGYLIAILPWALILIGLALAHTRRLPWVLLVLVLMHGVVTFNLSRPNAPGSPTRGSNGFWVEAGDLVTDIDFRRRFRTCTTLDSWNQKYREYGAEVRAEKRPPWNR